MSTEPKGGAGDGMGAALEHFYESFNEFNYFVRSSNVLKIGT